MKKTILLHRNHIFFIQHDNRLHVYFRISEKGAFINESENENGQKKNSAPKALYSTVIQRKSVRSYATNS